MMMVDLVPRLLYLPTLRNNYAAGKRIKESGHEINDGVSLQQSYCKAVISMLNYYIFMDRFIYMVTIW